VLDEDGAVLHAVHAIGAVPYLGHADAVVDEVFLGLGNGGRSPPWPAAFFASTYSCALSSQWSFKFLDELLRGKMLSCVVGGQPSWQRPHRVQASESKICFQVNSSSFPTPKLSAVSKSRIGSIEPAGFRFFINWFAGAVTIWSNRE